MWGWSEVPQPELRQPPVSARGGVGRAGNPLPGAEGLGGDGGRAESGSCVFYE